jgi:hypothetical protein
VKIERLTHSSSNDHYGSLAADFPRISKKLYHFFESRLAGSTSPHRKIRAIAGRFSTDFQKTLLFF